jgi:hypothetical protein
MPVLGLIFLRHADNRLPGDDGTGVGAACRSVTASRCGPRARRILDLRVAAKQAHVYQLKPVAV